MPPAIHAMLVSCLITLVLLSCCGRVGARDLLRDQHYYASTPTRPLNGAVQQQAIMERQYRALLALKASIAGEHGDRDLPSWKPSKAAASGGYCKWEGVVCTPHNLVEKILLVEKGLGGVLPPASVLQPLTALTTLRLARHAIGGTLPSSWSTLKQLLDLDLWGNDLTGTLPPSWGALKQLRHLWLHADGPGDLSGTLPASWSGMSSLQTLTLSQHDINGTLPPSWAGLKQLRILDLEDNKLTGPLPSAWSRFPNLLSLSLGYNDLTGSVPPSWGALSNLQSLRLQANNLSGTVPRSWSDGLKKLTRVDLDDNPGLEGCTGEWPTYEYPKPGPTPTSPRIFC